MAEFWMITLQYGTHFSTIAIDEHPAEWLIKFGNHRKPVGEKHIVFCTPITQQQFEQLEKLRP
jgi:hypothetical protein